MSYGPLENKVAIVTGAASGLGFAAAVNLMDEGAKVLLSDINEEVINEPCLRDFPISVRHNLVHLFMMLQMKKAWIDVIEKLKINLVKLIFLLNSAGISLGADVVSTEFDVWKKVHQVNLDSVFLGCKYAVPIMSKSGQGSIINLSSISGIVAGWNTAAYNSSKAGVRLLSKSVALYCAKKGYDVRCNSVHPAFVDTPILDPLKQAFGEENAVAKLISSNTNE